MRKLALITCLLVSSSILRSQDKDSSDIALRALADSTYKVLDEESKISELPAFREYYIMKVRFMSDSIKRYVLYTLSNNNLVVYRDPYTDNQLDTLVIENIRSLTFRKTGRTGEIISQAAAAGFLAGGAAGYVSRICWNCDSDGEPNLNAIGTGLLWGGIGAASGAFVGSLVAMFNNGSFTINGKPNKLKKHAKRIKKFSVK